MWVLAVMCTCIQMHACRIVCKIASMQVCARVYTGACRYVLRWSHQQRMGQNRRFSLATPVVSATWLGWHVCVTLHTLVGL